MISYGLIQMTDVGGEYHLVVQDTHLDKISARSLIILTGFLLFLELISLSWKATIGLRFAISSTVVTIVVSVSKVDTFYSSVRTRMLSQYLVLLIIATVVVIWLQFLRLERIWNRTSSNLILRLVRLNLKLHEERQTIFCESPNVQSVAFLICRCPYIDMSHKVKVFCC